MTTTGVAAAYDTVASEYDRQVESDRWMRQVLWAHYLRVFRPGERVLDVACGTGLDTIFLAQHGLHMTGVDISPAMIAQLQAKTVSQGLQARIEIHVWDAAELGAWSPGTFDGIISGFAGLNTLPDLRSFAADAARLLRPHGRLIVHLLNRFSIWEWLGLAVHGRVSAARNLDAQTERVFMIGGKPVRHYQYKPEEAFRRFFADRFDLRSRYSLGAVRPPPDMRHIPAGLAAMLARLEGKLNALRPFVNWGRFFVLDMENRRR